METSNLKSILLTFFTLSALFTHSPVGAAEAESNAGGIVTATSNSNSASASAEAIPTIVPFQLAGSDRLSLQQVQDLALRRNRDVVRAQIEVRKTEYALKAVKATRYPNILAIGFAGQQLNRPADANLAALPGVFEPVSQQYRIGLQVRQARLDVDVAKQKLRLTKQNAIAEVKRTYLKMVALKSAVESRQSDLKFLKTLVGYVEAEVRRGSALKVDAMVVQAREAKAEYELDKDSDDYITAGQTLNRLLDRPIRALITTSDDTQQLQNITAPPETAITQAVSRRPELFDLKLTANRFGLEQKVELSRYIPDISFGVTSIFSRGLDITLPRSLVSVGFLGVWQPWDWGRHVDLDKIAARQRQQKEIEYKDTADKVSVEADNARRALGVVEKQIHAALLNQSSSEEMLRVTDRRYQHGAAVLKDLTQAQANFSDAITETVKARSNYADALVEYDRATGKDFD